MRTNKHRKQGRERGKEGRRERKKGGKERWKIGKLKWEKEKGTDIQKENQNWSENERKVWREKRETAKLWRGVSTQTRHGQLKACLTCSAQGTFSLEPGTGKICTQREMCWLLSRDCRRIEIDQLTWVGLSRANPGAAGSRCPARPGQGRSHDHYAISRPSATGQNQPFTLTKSLFLCQHNLPWPSHHLNGRPSPRPG